MGETVHATCVAIGGLAVLIEGESGAGKSDLALRLIDRGAILVSDDYTRLSSSPEGLRASAPETIAGRMEVRGVGIVRMPFVSDAPVALLVSLSDEVERLPEARSRMLGDVAVPEVPLDARAPSAPIKVELALRRLGEETA